MGLIRPLIWDLTRGVAYSTDDTFIYVSTLVLRIENDRYYLLTTLQRGVLLRATCAGHLPDVSTGCSVETRIEFSAFQRQQTFIKRKRKTTQSRPQSPQKRNSKRFSY